MVSDGHHLEQETEVARPVSPLFGRLVAGVLGGILLAWISLGVCVLAFAEAQGITLVLGMVVLLIVGIGTFVHSVVFAVRSRRTAKIWRILILRSSAVAFATPLAVIVGLVLHNLRYAAPSLGAIVFFYAGGFGVVGGVVLRVIGLLIARPAVSTPKTASPSVPVQARQIEAGPPICPACGDQLQEMACNELVLDVCRNGCGGIWFDNFELRQATQSIHSLEEDWLPRVAAADERTHLDTDTKRPCPKCAGIRMLKHLFSDFCHIEVDECPSCGGIWLDSGEFEQIQASLGQQDTNTPRRAVDPETAVLMANLETEMEQSRQQTQARRGLCKFIGRRYCTPYRNCEL